MYKIDYQQAFDYLLANNLAFCILPDGRKITYEQCIKELSKDSKMTIEDCLRELDQLTEELCQ